MLKEDKEKKKNYGSYIGTSNQMYSGSGSEIKDDDSSSEISVNISNQINKLTLKQAQKNIESGKCASNFKSVGVETNLVGSSLH